MPAWFCFVFAGDFKTRQTLGPGMLRPAAMLALTMSTTLVATPIEDARPTAATYPVLSGLSYATCAAELSRQIDTYRKDMVVAAQRSDATALALEVVRGGPWQQQRLDTAAADLREKTRRLAHCWDANLQVLEELLRPFDVQSQETNSVACESVPAALPITTPPPLGLVLESRPKIAVADMVLYGVRGGQNNVTSDRSRNRDVAHPVYSHYSQVLFHVTLDWSTVGAMARHSIHAPLLRLIDAVYGAHETSKTGLSVLLPGCGAGRLVYELASRGFRVEAADSSVAAVAAAHSILFRLRPSLGSVESPGLSRSIYPYVIGDGRAEWDDEIRFAASPLFGDLEDADSPHSFFLDAMENVVDGIAAIQHVLRPGGRWFNVGPLHYHPHSTVTLDWTDLRSVIEAAGFDMLHVSREKEQWGDTPSLRRQDYNLIIFEARARFHESAE